MIIYTDSCHISKILKNPHTSRKTVYSNFLQLVFSDICGSASSVSTEGHHHYPTFVDASSNYNWLYLLRAKSEVIDFFVM